MDVENITNFDNIGNFGTPELLIMAGLGLAVLLFGYRIKKIAFFIIWFILGYNLMAFLMPTINNLVPQVADSSLYQILLPIAGGLLLALLGFSIEKLCVGGICFALVMVITVRYFGTDIQVLAIGGIIGIIAAGAAIMLMKPAIIVATAAAGAYALTVATLNLATNLDFGAYYWPMVLGITALGSIFQFVTTKRIS
ncbi:DUF4203 domain-containing protein [Candidatus Saccharibacteria bacterium]|nr:DUF4203 domain-containing protein [Candidatus Saccharibacteria bacterium]